MNGLDDARTVLPPRSGIRSRKARAALRLLDAGLELRQRALGRGRALDRLAAEMSPRRVLAIGIYGTDGAGAMAAALAELRDSRHAVEVALGAIGEAAPELRAETAGERLDGGKFANLNRVAERAAPLAADWVLILDDDAILPRGFLDRLLCVAERLRLDLCQPALTRASHTAWEVVRRRASLGRETRGVEIGPVTALRREVYDALTPFPEDGMGWGLDLHWAALAGERGWRLGVVDATPVRHERPPAGRYSHAEAMEAARRFLAAHAHLPYAEAGRTVARHDRLP